MHDDYAAKTQDYFSGARKQFVDQLPPNPSGRLLEIGCANGGTSAYALATGKCGSCVGVELCSEPAQEARKVMTEIVIGDIEQAALPYPAGYFDVLLMSEVLEHLRDPWAVLRKLRPLLKRGAIILAGSPNAAHHSVIRMLLRGRWDYADMGILDRTHLRWFTPLSYRALFESCGFEVESCGPATEFGTKARIINRITGGRFEYLLHTQIVLKAKPGNGRMG